MTHWWDEPPPGPHGELGRELREWQVAVLVDSREQLPYSFDRFGAITERSTLATGDYSLAGFEDLVAIERKSPEDLLHCVGGDRDRFVRELVRLSEIKHKAVIVEAPLAACYGISDVSPSSLVGSIAAWHIRYGVPFLFCSCRAEAQALCFRLLRAAAIELCRGSGRIRIKWLDGKQMARWERKCAREEAAAASALGKK